MRKELVFDENILEVPLDRLRDDVLNGIIDEFILREGTDYGLIEYSLDEKREQVKQQIRQGKALIVFDQRTESCTILSVSDLRR